MTKKSLIILLLFVILAGAAAGAFVFLNQLNNAAPPVTPGITGSPGSAGFLQEPPQSAAMPVLSAARAAAALRIC